MAQLQRWDPDTFLALMRETVPDYERLQDETVAATGTDALRVLSSGRAPARQRSVCSRAIQRPC
jgi:hypothetical protein